VTKFSDSEFFFVLQVDIQDMMRLECESDVVRNQRRKCERYEHDPLDHHSLETQPDKRASDHASCSYPSCGRSKRPRFACAESISVPNVPGDKQKPWDARLIEWISRDSQRAGGSLGSTLKERVLILAVWAGCVGIQTLTNGDSPWFGAFCAVVVIVGIASALRERRRAK
jgi:hypothetical protein